MTRTISSSQFSDVLDVDLAKTIDTEGIAATRNEVNGRIRQRLQRLVPPPPPGVIRQKYEDVLEGRSVLVHSLCSKFGVEHGINLLIRISSSSQS